jgi:hypothetical protein
MVKKIVTMASIGWLVLTVGISSSITPTITPTATPRITPSETSLTFDVPIVESPTADSAPQISDDGNANSGSLTALDDLAEALQRDVGMELVEFFEQGQNAYMAQLTLSNVDFPYDQIWMEGTNVVINLTDEKYVKQASDLGFEVKLNAEPPYSEVDHSQIEFAPVATEVYDDRSYRGGYGYGNIILNCSLGFASETLSSDGKLYDTVWSAGHCYSNSSSTYLVIKQSAPQVIIGSAATSKIQNSDLSSVSYQYGQEYDGFLLDVDYPTNWSSVPEVITWDWDGFPNGTGTGNPGNGIIPIYDAKAPVLNEVVCRSGFKTGLHCGKISKTDTVAVTTGSTPVSVRGFEAELCGRPGDSGGAIFSGNFAIGVTSLASNASYQTCEQTSSDDNVIIGFPIISAAGDSVASIKKLFPDSSLKIYVGAPVFSWPYSSATLYPDQSNVFTGYVKAKANAKIDLTIQGPTGTTYTTVQTDSIGFFNVKFANTFSNGTYTALAQTSAAPDAWPTRVTSSSTTTLIYTVTDAPTLIFTPENNGTTLTVSGTIHPDSWLTTHPNAKLQVTLTNPMGGTVTETVPVSASASPTQSIVFTNRHSGVTTISIALYDQYGALANSLTTTSTHTVLKPVKTDYKFTDTQTLNTGRQSAIKFLYEYAVTVGCQTTEYCPNNTINRGSFAELLYKLAGSPEFSASQTAFSDIGTLNASRQKAINWLAASGITLGCDAAGTKFCPGNPVNRGAAAQFLQKFAEFTDAEIAAQYQNASNPFADTAQLKTSNPPRYNAILWLASTGITKGTSKNGKLYYEPSKALNRGAMAEFLHTISGRLALY